VQVFGMSTKLIRDELLHVIRRNETCFYFDLTRLFVIPHESAAVFES